MSGSTPVGFVKGFSIPPPVPSCQVQQWIDYRAKEKADERRDDDAAAEAEKQKGIAAGAKNKENLVAAAQAVARRLGQFGVVTIDDVIREMERQGWTDLRGIEGGKAKNWKGSVFADSEWVCTGSISSRDKTAHGRHVRQWALKSWLRTHPVNGTASEASAFSLWHIYQEAVHFYPADTEFAFVLGSDMLDSSYCDLTSSRNVRYSPDGTAKMLNMDLYGCRVYVVHGIGATIIPLRAMDQEIAQIKMAHSLRGSDVNVLNV